MASAYPNIYGRINPSGPLGNPRGPSGHPAPAPGGPHAPSGNPLPIPHYNNNGTPGPHPAPTPAPAPPHPFIHGGTAGNGQGGGAPNYAPGAGPAYGNQAPFRSATDPGYAAPQTGPANVGGTGGFGFTNMSAMMYANPAPTGERSGYATTPTGMKASDYNESAHGFLPSGGYTGGMAAQDNGLNAAYGRIGWTPPEPPPAGGPSGSPGPSGGGGGGITGGGPSLGGGGAGNPGHGEAGGPGGAGPSIVNGGGPGWGSGATPGGGMAGPGGMVTSSGSSRDDLFPGISGSMRNGR